MDWWELDPAALEVLLEGTSNADIRMAHTFSGSVNLEEVVVSSPQSQNTASPTGPIAGRSGTVSPGPPVSLSDRITTTDGDLPEPRELRKFVRRLPRLRCLRWTGRGGRGEWHFSKKSTLVANSFTLRFSHWDIGTNVNISRLLTTPMKELDPAAKILELPRTPVTPGKQWLSIILLQ